MVRRVCVYVFLGICLGMPGLGFTQTPQVNTTPPHIIVIKNHQFDPLQLNVPAGEKLQITVDNQDPTPEEFESFDLDREQVVAGGKKIIVYIGPLKPGTYKYWGDFHQDTTKGTIVAQ